MIYQTDYKISFYYKKPYEESLFMRIFAARKQHL